MTASIPNEEEVLGYLQSLCNWGRWGDDDELGTLNLITPEKIRQSTTLVKEGLTVSCSKTVTWDPAPDNPIPPPMHFMLRAGEGWSTGEKLVAKPQSTHASISQFAEDYFGMAFHGHAVTHVDSLSHCFWEGRMYNGRPAHLVSTSLGATVESIEVAKKGIVSRGVLVDAPMIRGIDWLERGEGVMPEDILAAEERCGFEIEEGDVLLVRTGQLHRRRVEGPADPRVVGTSACQVGCLPLLHQRGVAMLGCDTGNDVQPSGYKSLTNPIHQVGLVAMGLWTLDNADLEELAQVCREKNRWEFMISIGPLRLSNTTGSPVNPVAIF